MVEGPLIIRIFYTGIQRIIPYGGPFYSIRLFSTRHFVVTSRIKSRDWSQFLFETNISRKKTTTSSLPLR